MISGNNKVKDIKGNNINENDFCIDITRLSRFKEIARGGFGTIYKAKLNGCKEPVAVKVLTSTTDIDTECFIREAAILNSLNHKNIVKFIGICFIPKGTSGICESYQNERISIIEEFIKGKTLNNIILENMTSSCKSYSDYEAVDILLQIAEGVRYLHSYRPKLIHRDLTPSNIIITRQKKKYNVKLIDFGLVAMLDDDGIPIRRVRIKKFYENNKLSKEKLCNCVQSYQDIDSECYFMNNNNEESGTNADAICMNINSIKSIVLTGNTGTYIYMAPEIYSMEPYDEKSDIYSFGIIMYELITRYNLSIKYSPNYEKSDAINITRRLSLGFRPSFKKKATKFLTDIIERCWCQEKQERPDISEIISDLHNYHKKQIELELKNRGCFCFYL